MKRKYNDNMRFDIAFLYLCSQNFHPSLYDASSNCLGGHSVDLVYCKQKKIEVKHTVFQESVQLRSDNHSPFNQSLVCKQGAPF